MLQNKNTLKIFSIIFMLFASNMFIHSTKAAVNEIEAYDGVLSKTNIVRGEEVNFFATLVNIGNESFEVISINVMFVNINGSERYNSNYSRNFNTYHRTLDAQESMTATLKAKITNVPSYYNVSIFFVAEDIYNANNPLSPLPNDYFAVKDVVVRVIDMRSSSGIVLGIGIGFVSIVGVTVLVLIGSYIKNKLKEKRY